MGACRLQEQLREDRNIGRITDFILILQHPPVLTVGKSGYKPEHILVTDKTLEHDGISLCQTNRGGGITYHGPGQLVCYPIFNLRNLGLTVRQYLYNLEEVVITSLAGFGITGQRLPSAPGVWVEDAEISSIGVHISRGITMHGFTLNVNSDLKHFSYIDACGVSGKKITTVARISGTDISMENLILPLLRSFGQIFNLDITQEQSKSLDIHYE
ncbi:MAG: lipoyl(octanoyl) transferase [Chloroflexi bacterium RBG_16_50_9]|nr:MAG: lipoyl(octanoyl) transferase [Chloroflexi bacterium RBG_16_50_9]